MDASKPLVGKRSKASQVTSNLIYGALAAAGCYAFVFSVSAFQVRYQSFLTSITGVVLAFVAASSATLLIVQGVRQNKPIKTRVIVAAGLWCGLLAGKYYGDWSWYTYADSFFTLQDMASYVNVDPSWDKGTSYMDAGAVYFKSGTHVLRDKAIAFRNNEIYCVAPIVRTPLSNATTAAGLALPRSGTVDFWAVGKGCCAITGENFTCHDVGQRSSRSGLRVLDSVQREMYLLAVQEWSSTTGLPATHPLFFYWVKDPIRWQESMYDSVSGKLWVGSIAAVAGGLIGAGIIHAMLTTIGLH